MGKGTSGVRRRLKDAVKGLTLYNLLSVDSTVVTPASTEATENVNEPLSTPTKDGNVGFLMKKN